MLTTYYYMYVFKRPNSTLFTFILHTVVKHLFKKVNAQMSSLDSSDSKLLEDSTERICSNFAINNTHTGNFGALVHNFLVRAAELKASAQCEE